MTKEGSGPLETFADQFGSLRRGRIVVTGAAGLVGQNLIPRLKARGYADIVAIDKHHRNTAILAKLHQDVEVVEADLCHGEGWQEAFEGAQALIMLHAQIGGLDERDFIDNNITATERVLEAARHASLPYLVHISSSVVNSAASDFYTESKKAQEALVRATTMPAAILRPTLMFGWFDRKHLGWLARFMGRAPVFPVPGNGRYTRQPLYAGDFANIIMACLDQRIAGETFNISGLQAIDYIDLIRALRAALRLKTPIIKIPYGVFRALLEAYALLDRNPPFTVQQLKALVTPDMFEVIDWPGIFGVAPTPLDTALRETFDDPTFSTVVLEF